MSPLLNLFSRPLRGMSPALSISMEASGNTVTAVAPASSDIVFACAHCATSLIVDQAAAGASLPCQNCGKQTTVPQPSVETGANAALRLSEVEHQLKENESQRTEVTGYINQLNIQVHRWQLRLQSLNDRQIKLRIELAEIRGASQPPRSTG